MRRLILAFGLLLVVAPVAGAACVGRDLIAELPPAEQDALRAAVDAVPHSRGLFWQAEKDDARIVLIGTYHFGDTRHDSAIERFSPVITEADALLVEAGPDEETKLTQALQRDPSLMSDTDGSTLPERLEPEEWERLAGALEARNIPAVVGSRLRPWYVATVLGLSPCMLNDLAEQGDNPGLDHRLIAVAEESGTPVRALEPWDTLFSVFKSMSPEEELDMIRAALPQAERADDFAVTMLNAYFDEDVWALWEFGRMDALTHSGLSSEAVEQQVGLMQRELMNKRNRAWIARLEDAATQAAAGGKPVVAAFGALHLPGEGGVLSLLERDGWSVTRIE